MMPGRGGGGGAYGAPHPVCGAFECALGGTVLRPQIEAHRLSRRVFVTLAGALQFEPADAKSPLPERNRRQQLRNR